MKEFLIWIIVCSGSTFGITYLFCKINKFKKMSFLSWTILLLGSLFITFMCYYEINSIRVTSYFIFFPLLFYVISKFNFRKLLIETIIIYFYGILLDFVSMFAVTLTYNIFKWNVNSYIFKVIPTILVLLMFLVLGNTEWLKKLTNKLYSIFSKIKYADFMLIIFTAFILIVAIMFAINIEKINVGFLICIIVVLVIFIFVILLKAKYIDIENKIFLETLKRNNSFYVDMEDEHSIFKHNLMSKLLSVKSVSNSKARILLDELIKDFNTNIDYHSKIKDIPYGLNGILNEKLNDYNEILEIKVSNQITKDIFDVLSPKRYNVLVEKLSLLLDNAIEACLLSMDKVLVINIIEENNSIKIEIKNTFGGDIDIDSIGKLHYSTKSKKHGFGLYSILRNNEVSANVKIINEYFVSELIAKYIED